MALFQTRTARRRARYEAIFQNTEEGRAELVDMTRRYRVLGATTVEADPIMSAYRDGQRSVVIEILRTLALTPDDLIKIAQQSEAEAQ